MKKVKKTLRKQRGGWPKRESVSVMLRLSPATAKLLDELAKQRDWSRSKTGERLIEAFSDALLAVDADLKWDRSSPEDVIERYGKALVWKVADHRIAPDHLVWATRAYESQLRDEVAQDAEE